MENEDDMEDDGHLIRKMRILKKDRQRGFKRCKKCRSVNPLSATECFNCGTPFPDMEAGSVDTSEE